MEAAARVARHHAWVWDLDAAVERRPLAVVRDAEHWSFLESRTSSFFERLQDDAIRASELEILHEATDELTYQMVSASKEGLAELKRADDTPVSGSNRSS